MPRRSPAPGPRATFAPAVRAAVRACRREHPRAGADRGRLALAADSALTGLALPAARTIHRAWVAAGLVPARLPRDAPPAPSAPAVPPDDPHAVWEPDHQDGLRLGGLADPVVLQGIRAPAAGLVVAADLFPGPHGAHAVPEDDALDGVRRALVRRGRPRVLSVDRGVRFFGQPQPQFPSRLEPFRVGLGLALRPIRPGHPTDHGAIERQHRPLDGPLRGPVFADLDAAQRALDARVAALNARFPSRSRACGGRPPRGAHPTARHSGRPYDPATEWDRFDLAAVDRVLAGWAWHRLAGARTGQVGFGNRNVGGGRAWAGQPVTLHFDGADRQVVISAPGHAPGERGPGIKRFWCPAFDRAAILGTSHVAPRPPAPTARAGDSPPRP